MAKTPTKDPKLTAKETDRAYSVGHALTTKIPRNTAVKGKKTKVFTGGGF